ncbi:MAG: ATP synthase F1 subunit delta [Flavobacteriaceae bacterium]|jgi:F-type H+-transporting ATPase subunit delta
MKMSRAAYRYAKAALKFAGKDPAPLAKDLENILALLEANDALSAFLENPVLPAKLKTETLLKVCPKHTKSFAQLLDVLATNNRLSIVAAVAQQYSKLYAAQQGQLTATVITAVPLTPALEDQILQKAKSITSKQVQLVNQVDPAILGGFVLTLGDMQYDASVAQKLKGIKTALMTKQ